MQPSLKYLWGEDSQRKFLQCAKACMHVIKPWLVGEVCSCQISWEHLTTKEEIIEISKLSQRKEKDLETKASNKRKAFEKLWVVGVNLAVEASSPVPNDKTLYYINSEKNFYLGLPFACMLNGSTRISARTQYWGAVAESQFGWIRTLGRLNIVG